MKNIFKHYEAPKAEVIEIEAQGAFCASAVGGNNTETVGINTFGWI
jgi:hypothetical protein